MKGVWPWQPVTASSHYCLHPKAGGPACCSGAPSGVQEPRLTAGFEKELLQRGCWKEPGVLRTDKGAR